MVSDKRGVTLIFLGLGMGEFLIHGSGGTRVVSGIINSKKYVSEKGNGNITWQALKQGIIWRKYLWLSFGQRKGIFLVESQSILNTTLTSTEYSEAATVNL